MTNPNAQGGAFTQLTFEELSKFEIAQATAIATALPKLAVDESIDVQAAPLDVDALLCRPRLRDLLRPRQLQGTMKNLQVEVLDDAYDLLLSAKERDQTRIDGLRTGLKRSRDEVADRALSLLTMGFRFHSDITVKGVAGHAVSSEVFYCPVPLSRKSTRYGGPYIQQVESYGGLCVARVVMAPEVEASALERHRSAMNAEHQKSVGFGHAVQTGSINLRSWRGSR